MKKIQKHERKRSNLITPGDVKNPAEKHTHKTMCKENILLFKNKTHRISIYTICSRMMLKVLLLAIVT